MDCSFQHIHLERVAAENATFRISTQNDLAALCDSIQRLGLITPPVLLQQGDQYLIVSGFRRLGAIQALGWRMVPARLLPEETTFAVCAHTAIIENSFQRPLNIVEQANALRLLTQSITDPALLVETAVATGLAVNRTMVAKLKQIEQMAPEIKRGLVSGTIALPVAERLHELDDPGDAVTLANLLSDLNLSLNRQRELVDWLEAIGHRDQTGISALLDQDPVRGWRQDADLDRRRKVELIRQHIRAIRYPAITTAEERYHSIVQQMTLPGGSKLSAPAFFEGSMYTLQFDFKTLNELDRFSQELISFLDSPQLKTLLQS